MKPPPSTPVWSLICDRCGHPYKAHEPTPLCLRCAVANDAAEHRGDWERPLTTLELILAVKAARNHPSRRRRP